MMKNCHRLHSSLFLRHISSLTLATIHVLIDGWLVTYPLRECLAVPTATYGRRGQETFNVVSSWERRSFMTSRMEYRYSVSGSSINFLNNVAVVGFNGVCKAVFGEGFFEDPYPALWWWRPSHWSWITSSVNRKNVSMPRAGLHLQQRRWSAGVF